MTILGWGMENLFEMFSVKSFLFCHKEECEYSLYDNSMMGEWRTFSKMFSVKGFLFCHKEECEYISFMTILSFLGEWENGGMENLFENVLRKRVFILS